VRGGGQLEAIEPLTEKMFLTLSNVRKQLFNACSIMSTVYCIQWTVYYVRNRLFVQACALRTFVHSRL
jgi:hypothetical protein